MPTILRIGPYRFSFYAADIHEPPHVHVKSDGHEAKIWLKPKIKVAFANGFSPHEVRRIERLVARYQSFLLKKWNEFLHHS